MTDLNIGHQETGTEWVHIGTCHRPHHALSTKQQHADPMPNTAHATKATAQQVGRLNLRLQFTLHHIFSFH